MLVITIQRIYKRSNVHPKKRIENAYTQYGRIAKLRLSECSANSFEHCRALAVYLNPPERPFAEQILATVVFVNLCHFSRELKAFAKTRELQPNQSETLTMNLSLYDLASYNEATQAWETAPSKYTIGFGASVDDIRATAPYSLSKQHTVKCHDVMKPDMDL